MLNFLAGALGKYLLWGGVGALVVGGVILWHQLNFVPRSEVRYWQEYAKQLERAAERKDEIMRQYESEREAAEAKLADMEREREGALEEDRKGDDPVLLDRRDVDRLRAFTNRR